MSIWNRPESNPETSLSSVMTLHRRMLRRPTLLASSLGPLYSFLRPLGRIRGSALDVVLRGRELAEGFRIWMRRLRGSLGGIRNARPRHRAPFCHALVEPDWRELEAMLFEPVGGLRKKCLVECIHKVSISVMSELEQVILIVAGAMIGC